MKTRELTLVAMMTALTVILAQLSIPIGPVPITLSVLSVYLSGVLLGKRLGTMAIILYIILGGIGLPVFAQFSGGPQVLFGPTGGYLFGYILATFVIGAGFEYSEGNAKQDYIRFILLSFVGLILIYTLGVIQLKFVLQLPWTKAYHLGIAPFVVLDIIKIFVAGMITLPVRAALAKSNLIPFNGLNNNG